MSEGRVFFQGDDRLEAMLGWPVAERAGTVAGVRGPATGESEPVAGEGGAEAGFARGGVVVAHPYPPRGANMDLPVIYRMAKSCRQRELATLRFNFRSVGASSGTFSGTEEHRDVTAAVSFMRERLDSAGSASGGAGAPLGLAGWSFGSVMAARAAADPPEIQALALVGFVPRWEHLPTDTLERLACYGGPVLAVCAENDDIGSPEDVEAVLTELGLDFTLEVVRGADHFLQSRHREVGELVAGFFQKVLAP